MPRAKLEEFGESVVRLSTFARALAHPARIRILRHLVQEGELTCMEVVSALPLSQPACSRHIAELLECGLVKSREEGRRIFLKVDRRALDGFCKGMSRALHPESRNRAQPARRRPNAAPLRVPR